MEGGTGLPLHALSRWQGATTVFKDKDCELGTEADLHGSKCGERGLKDSPWRVLSKVPNRLEGWDKGRQEAP